jgi:hypothetical protein
MLRAVIGFVVAPFIGVALSTLILLRGDLYTGWWIYLLAGSAIAYVSALVLGLPAYLVMKRITSLAWWQIAIAGGLCGLPYWLISEYPYTSAYFQNQGVKNLVLYVGSGVIAGLVFWFITQGPAPSNITVERDARKSGARPSL